ncbi:hypothetical protein Tco_1141811 [Tanacetum coccineum]
MVIREPESGRIQPLPDVQGKGKENVSDEQVALDLLTLQTPNKKSLTEHYIFQRRTPTTTEPFGHTEYPSLYGELGLTDSETESDEEMSPEINAGTQDEGQAEPNPGEQDEGQARPNPAIQDEGQVGSNPGDAAKSQPQSSHVVYTGPNLEHIDFEENLKFPTEVQVILEEPASSAGTLSSLQNLDKELSFTNQFLVEKSQKDEPDKSNTKAKVQSMVTVPIHQDTSSVPLMTTPVIDLTMSQPVSTTVQAPLPTSTATVTLITTTTSLTPPPPQPQQSIADLILICRIRELEQHMADLLQSNLALEERLDKHGSRLYKLENLNIPHQVNKALDEVVTNAVDWAMQALLRARFSDLPTIDMKEILHQRMFEDNSYESYEVHDEARMKKRKRRASPRTPPGSPPSHPPPLPPSAGASGAPGTSGASGSSQFPPPPPPPSTGTSRSTPQQGRRVPSSSKTTASAQQFMAWTTSDTRYESTGIAEAQKLSPSDDLMHDDSISD